MDLTDSLSYEDIEFMAEYLKVTPITRLDLSIPISGDNVHALAILANVIALNKQLCELNFEVLLDFNYFFKHNFPIGLFDFIDDHRLKKIGTLIENALAIMLDNKPVLQKLDIDLTTIDHPLSNSGSKTICNKISKLPLKKLSLAFSTHLDANLVVLNTKKANQTLTHLYLRGFDARTNALEGVCNANALKVLSIENLNLGRNDLDHIAQIAKSNPNLTSITISHTNLGQLNVNHLFTWLNDCRNLACLDLSSNNLSLLNIAGLCNYLDTDPPNLLELDLSGNTLMATDACQLAHTLEKNTHLERLTLDKNYIEDKGVQSILELVKKNKHIKQLSISQTCRNNPSDKTIEHLCNFIKGHDCQLTELIFKQSVTLSQYLLIKEACQNNPKLSELTLGVKINDLRKPEFELPRQSLENTLFENNNEDSLNKEVHFNPVFSSSKPKEQSTELKSTIELMTMH